MASVRVKIYGQAGGMDSIGPKGPKAPKTWDGLSGLLDFSSVMVMRGVSGMPETTAKVTAATRMTDALSGLLGASPVREGPAGLKGRGVFATRAVRRGEVCTAYPCDMLNVTDGGGARMMGLTKVDGSAPAGEGDVSRLLKYAQFLRRDESGRMWELIGDPSRPFRAGACGHLINDPHPDARTIQKATDGCSEAYGREMIKYLSSVTGRANCVMKPHRSGMCVLVVAARDIADGEELLAPYGYGNWSDAADPERMLAEFTRTRTAKQAKAMRAVMAPYVALSD